MVFSLSKELKTAHDKAISNVSDYLEGFIDYVMKHEGFEDFDINDVKEALAARAAKTEQTPDYDMVLWVLQNDPTFYPEADRSKAFEMPEEAPHIV